MIVLGLSMCHNSSACVIIDGEIKSAISRERLCRIKGAEYIRDFLIEYVLEEAGVSLDDIDFVAISYWIAYDIYNPVKLYMKNEDLWIFDKPRFRAKKKYEVPPKQYTGLTYIDFDLPSLVKPYLVEERACLEVKVEIYNRLFSGYLIDHHHAHAASTFFTSDFNESAIFTYDSTDVNPYQNSLFSIGQNTAVESYYYPGMQAAYWYANITQMLGLGPGTEKSGTLMGLAPYGDVNPEIKNNINEFTQSYWERNFRIEEYKFSHNLFSRITGYPAFDYNATILRPYNDDYQTDFGLKNKSDSQEAMDAAATMQFIFEENIFKFLNVLYEKTSSINGGNLCLAGGGALNCTTNGKITQRTPFKNVHVYPAAGDDGLSIGAAFYVLHNIWNVKRYEHKFTDIVYTGKEYITPQGGKSLDLKYIAQQIHNGKVVAWFQGGSEFGPRALGHRSFFANPTINEMRDYINLEIKNREWFRPFAPVVCVEDYPKYFSLDSESPFMLKICDVLTDELPSITHVDGTARPQTLRREDNNLVYDLLREFEKLSGFPVLLNTSLNLKGEPIVETPEDVFKLYKNSKVDILVINDSMWEK